MAFEPWLLLNLYSMLSANFNRKEQLRQHGLLVLATLVVFCGILMCFFIRLSFLTITYSMYDLNNNNNKKLSYRLETGRQQ